MLCFWGGIKPLHFVGQAAELQSSSLSPNLSPCSLKAVPEGNWRFRGQINGQALKAALSCTDWAGRSTAWGVSETAAVAEGSNMT